MDDLSYAAHLPDLGAALDLAAIGVGPAIDPRALDEDNRLANADGDELLTAIEMCERGPAAAVFNVEELVQVGLPRDLPGGLAALALSHREELVARVSEVQALRARCLAVVKAAAASAAMKQSSTSQASSRKLGMYDKKRAGRLLTLGLACCAAHSSMAAADLLQPGIFDAEDTALALEDQLKVSKV